MKEKVVMRESKPSKDEIMAMAKAGSKKKKRMSSVKSEDFRSRFLGNLMLRRQEAQEAIKRLTDNQKEYEALLTARDVKEEVDHAEREISAQTHYRLLERKNKELKKIDILIRGILGNEEFGRCEECGKQIPEERLLIVPEATRCVPCQRETEKWELRGNLAEISHASSRRKKESGWAYREHFDDGERLSFKPDMEYMSFMDLGETDLEEPKGDNNDK